MKIYTNEEIINKVKDIWGCSPTIIRNDPDYVKFELNEYSSVKVKQLFELCRFFDTQEIEEETQRYSGGYCETCSYEYTVPVFIVRPTPEKENERLYNKI